MNAPFQSPPGSPGSDPRQPLKLLIAAPRGFCAGVDRAIEIVERALQKYGAPVYVRHEIVHNRYVVDSLKAKGAIFVEELDEVPDDAPVVFSAHGVPKTIPAEAERRKMLYVDATCPLVSKVHRQAERQIEKGQHILFIGHAGHPEVIGTMGQVPEGRITLVETIDDVATLDFAPTDDLSYLSQTTLSVDDTRDIINALEARFPQIIAPKAEDICYATSNRQAAVKQIAANCDLVLVIGAPNSSNSLRLVEVAERLGTNARLIQRADEIDPAWLEGVGTIGLTAGASAPEKLVREVVDRLCDWRLVDEEVITATEENMVFQLPRQLTASRGRLYPSRGRGTCATHRALRCRRTRLVQGHRRRGLELQLAGRNHARAVHPDDVRTADRDRRPAVFPRLARPSFGRTVRGAAHDP